MAKLDYKASGWASITFKDELIPQVVEKLQEGYQVAELYDVFGDDLLYHPIDPDTESMMTPIENNENPTIQIFDNEGVINYDNSIEKDGYSVTKIYYTADLARFERSGTIYYTFYKIENNKPKFIHEGDVTNTKDSLRDIETEAENIISEHLKLNKKLIHLIEL